ncbi:PhzF family phenazine biosynthesis protein [Ilyomonas limi]|uniref:PhzF family phenazine biosynthesis protein n=1 Tax=Ilyomonas limi TaxID=2575867 RepID=A0A4U3KXU7_9BACT|nr:PhzF family phenazine biosynthesis protein [Ilyomonas limi]TKK67428.1 PhzF family phenazine biosynthesis protein [Ilyomonas limi]
MRLPVYIADAFTHKLFSGNPAAVCPLTDWLPDELMQQIAAENNLSETVFFVPQQDGAFTVRWFTPTVEVKLCGHATLAAAHIMYTELSYDKEEIVFLSASGKLVVTKVGENKYQLDFPANTCEEVTDMPEGLFEGLKIAHAPVFKSSFDYMVVLPSQQAVEDLQPAFSELAKVKARGVICTAKGEASDVVARCFYPQSGINEDPVTGSAHTIIIPYWAKQLGKNQLKSTQLSKRKGYLDCELRGERVLMRGEVVTYLKGTFFTEENKPVVAE